MTAAKDEPPRFAFSAAWPPIIVCPDCFHGLAWSSAHLRCGYCGWIVLKSDYLQHSTGL